MSIINFSCSSLWVAVKRPIGHEISLANKQTRNDYKLIFHVLFR